MKAKGRPSKLCNQCEKPTKIKDRIVIIHHKEKKKKETYYLCSNLCAKLFIFHIKVERKKNIIPLTKFIKRR